MSKGRNFGTGGTLVALLAAAGAGASFPFYYARGAVKTDISKPLPETAIMRGPYVNTGSRDVGPDPAAGSYEVGKYSK